MKKVCKELVDFFQNQDGWDKDEILSEWASKSLSELGCVMQPSNIPISMDEIVLYFGKENLRVTLQDFSNLLFKKMITGVCNVIKTA